MFLNFGKKNSSVKKPATPSGSPITPPSPIVNSPGSVGVNAVSRSTVQTVAGPLLSSSRFNTILDASTFANVNSPGFTSRVVNCATNGSSSTFYHENNATHQSKYSAVGLFPRVQLGQSILPTLSPHNSQKVKTPVRVRIAPPSLSSRRQNSIGTPTESIQGKTESPKVSSLSSLPKSSCDSSSGLNDILQETSRKRIFSESQESSQDESKKRRRKAELPIPNPNDDTYHYRHVRAPAVPTSPPQPDVSSQGKRAREKGSPEEQKRQRRKVCNTNNAIFSSLSSSRNLLERITAQKRKSADTSSSKSPLNPLNSKQVKDSKTCSNVKATQCNLDDVLLQEKFSGDLNQQEGTPVSSKGITKRVSFTVKETSSVSPEKTQHNSTPDYTTKLFRKEVSSHAPRTPTSKIPKQSLWVQPPEADELSSLLNDESNLHRPERLKSLLARVSGKDNQQEIKTAATASAVSTISLPVSTGTGFKPLSPTGGPSSALTMTVSSTCTIMTSATVTSVNGIPSSESGSSPRPVVSASLSSTALVPNSQAVISIMTTQESTVKTTSLSSTASPAAPLTSQPLVLGQQATLSTPLFKSSATTGNGQGIPTSSMTQTSNMFSIKSPTKNSETPQSGTVQTSTAVAKAMFQFGSSTQAANTAPTLSLGSVTSTPASSAGANSAFQFAPGTSNPAAISVPTLGASSDASPTVPFGSSSVSKPAFQLGTGGIAVKSTSSDMASASKPAFSFGSSGSVPAGASKAAFQLGSSLPNGTSTTSTIELGSTGMVNNASSEAPKSAFQFSSTTESPKPAFQLGSASGLPATSSSTFQFGSSSTNQGPSEAPKSAFQFGSSPSNNVPSENPKPSFSFGSSSDSSKSNFQFGSSNSSTIEATKSAPSFGSNHNLMTPAKSPFQFGGSSSGPAPTVPGTRNSAVQFSSNISSDALKPAFALGSGVNKANDLPKPAFGSTVQSPTSPFGQATPQQSKSAFAFGSSGNLNSNGPSENKAAFSFSSPNNNKSAFSFGSSTHQSSTGPTDNKSAFSFGSSTNQSSNGPTDNKSASLFGASANQSTNRPADNKGTFSFGASANQSTNGPSSNKNGFGFGIAANQSTNVPAANKGAFSFGSTDSTLVSPASNSSFGSGPTSSAFGAPASNTQSALPSFGSLSESKTNGFASTPSFGSTGSNAFSFASNTSSSSGNSGGAYSFAGGSSVATNGAFSFGQKSDQASSGFNFNVAVTAVPNPAQANQAPGLFSIGAGASSTQRRVRDARRRR